MATQITKSSQCRISIFHSLQSAELGQESYLFHASRKCADVHTQRPGRYESNRYIGLLVTARD